MLYIKSLNLFTYFSANLLISLQENKCTAATQCVIQTEQREARVRFSSNLSIMARDLRRDESVTRALRILICISLVIDTFLLLTPADQSEPVLTRTDQSEASMLSAGARSRVCVGIQTKVLCCDQHQHPMCGMTKSNILKWGYIFQDSSSSK